MGETIEEAEELNVWRKNFQNFQSIENESSWKARLIIRKQRGKYSEETQFQEEKMNKVCKTSCNSVGEIDNAQVFANDAELMTIDVKKPLFAHK